MWCWVVGGKVLFVATAECFVGLQWEVSGFGPGLGIGKGGLSRCFVFSYLQDSWGCFLRDGEGWRRLVDELGVSMIEAGMEVFSLLGFSGFFLLVERLIVLFGFI